jgi:hypothetical protein
MLTIHRQHHPRLDDRLYVPMKEGGRPLIHLEKAYVAEVNELREYIESKEDPLVRIVRTHQHHTNSSLLQTVNDFRKLFEVKQSK